MITDSLKDYAYICGAMKRKRERGDRKEEGQGEKVYHRTEMKSQLITLNHISIFLKIT